jgi:hypothetical protein
VLAVTVEGSPSPLGAVTGPAALCPNANATYSVAYTGVPVTYNWSVPVDANIVGGQGTDTIQVIWGSLAGDVSVYANNLCDTTTAVSKPVTIDTNPTAAGLITGKDTVCKGHTGYAYSIPVIANATSYIWTLPSGATISSGSGTNAITVDFSLTAVTGDISVYGRNTCGNGTPGTKNLLVDDCSGINDNALNAAIRIYPNPADKELFIAVSGSEKQLNLLVTDVQGQVVYKETLTGITAGYTKRIDVSGFAKGIYFIKLSNSNRVFIDKVVVD